MSDLKSVDWRDWGWVGIRAASLALLGFVLFTSRTPEGSAAYAVNDVLLALEVAAAAIILYAVLLLFAAARSALPIILLLVDWLMVGFLVYAANGDSLLLALIAGLVTITSIARLGPAWGAAQAVGVLVACAVALAVLSGGLSGLSAALSGRATAFWAVAGLAAAAIAWAFIQEMQTTRQERELSQALQSRSEQLKDLRERTRAIYEMSVTLSKTLDFEKILAAALSAGTLGLREFRKRGRERLISAVLLMQQGNNMLYVVTGRGLSRQDQMKTIPGKDGIVGQALSEGVPVFGGPARKDPELQYFTGFYETRSMLCIPLKAGWDTFGILLYGCDTPEAFTDEHTELLTAIGIQATVALQNAVLYRNLLAERDRLVEVEEEARKKLARDLHDGPTQSVAAIAMRMNIITRMLEKTPDEVPAELKKVEDIARRTTKEIRHMLFTLRPLVLENQGLTAALNQLAEKMKETHEQNVLVRVGPDVEDVLDTHQQGVIFYIIEEAVGNARKHAEAKLISVSLTRQDDIVMVRISDNGKGFDVKAAENNSLSRGGHLGMVNMRERAQLLDGTLNMESAPGRGTVITVLVPIKEQPPAAPGGRRVEMPLVATTKLAAAAMERLGGNT